MIVSGLHIYPVKSIKGLSPESLVITEEGPEYDRRYMVVRAEDGLFITARTDPALLAVTAKITETGDVILSAPEQPDLALPSTDTLHQHRHSTVWGDDVQALDTGDDAATWFSTLLGKETRLVAMPNRGRIRLNKAGGDMAVSFADGYPLLGTTLASLDDLNTRLNNPVTMSRFRPNLVIDGSDAFAEDKWYRLQVGTVPFLATSACSRCILTTRDPESGEKSSDMEPMRSLGKFRRGSDGQVYFGTNLRPLATGVIHLGDPVTIVEEGDSLLP